MHITPIDHQPFTLPLPLYESVLIAATVSRDDQKFSLYVGLSQMLVDQLKTYSLDETDHELSVTSDRKRFGEGSYADWYAKDRVPFALVHDASGSMAALAWYGPKPIGRKPAKHLSAEESQQDERTMDADNWATVVYRSYKPFRGKGLMKDFVRFTMDTYMQAYPGVRMWAGVDGANAASLGLAQALGFVVDEDASDRQANWLVVTKT